MQEALKKVYYCEFCGKHYLHSGYAKKHEEWCAKNPAMIRPCLSCLHLDTEEIQRYVDGYDGEHSFTVKSMKCEKTNKHFYHPRIERFGWFKSFGVGEEQESMPKKCDSYCPMFGCHI